MIAAAKSAGGWRNYTITCSGGCWKQISGRPMNRWPKCWDCWPRWRRHRAGGYGEAGSPRPDQQSQDPRHSTARETGTGANAASLPLRPAGARLRRRAGRWLHRHRRIQPRGAAGGGSQRGAGQRPQHQDHQAQRYGLGAPVSGRGNLAPRTVSEYRTGLGWDVHRLAPNRPLILGGVAIPSDLGLEGHSDADVLAHAITDAILGAAALGDIGMHFPDTDPRWQGAGSLMFLAHARDLARARGYRIVNVDSTVILERPKLKDYRDAIRRQRAATLELDADRVSVKFKTAEKVGPVGEGRSAEAQAIVTLRLD